MFLIRAKVADTLLWHELQAYPYNPYYPYILQLIILL